MLRDPATIRRIAKETVKRVYSHGKEAVKRVYSHGSGAGDIEGARSDKTEARKEKLEKQRKALGQQFREKYDSFGPIGPNVVPHFIGVWDTVAAVGLSPPIYNIVRAVAALLLLAISAGVAWWIVGELTWQLLYYFLGISASFIALAYIIYIAMRVKFVTGLRGCKWYQTLHLTSFKMAFFDRTLHPHVRYARHAIAIDETRKDFDRVPWVNEGKPPNRAIAEGPWFVQFWFAGNHSDIGGSYIENESRLSDIALKWMANQAKKAGLIVNDQYLRLFGHHNGPQHDETRVGINILFWTFKWATHTRKMVGNATIHPSVHRRFAEERVLIYDKETRYRPDLLRRHVGFKSQYDAEEKALLLAQEKAAAKAIDAGPKSA